MILSYLIFSLALFFINDLMTHAVFSVCILLVVAFVPSIDIKKGIIPISLFILFTFAANIFYGSGRVIFSIASMHVTDGGLSVAAVRALRVFELIYAARILGALVPIAEMTEAMSTMLQPLGKVGLPVNKFFEILRLTLHCLPMIKDRVQQECSRFINDMPAGVQSSGVKMAFNVSRVFIPDIIVPVFISSIMQPEQYFKTAPKNKKYLRAE
ncbi:MAG: hypothetical protein JXR79_01300 [Nitrospirae bacterium]|nr:hypothetical protein [Nitrospirota bacterium]